MNHIQGILATSHIDLEGDIMDLRRITAEYCNDQINILFAIRKDAVPIYPKKLDNTRRG